MSSTSNKTHWLEASKVSVANLFLVQLVRRRVKPQHVLRLHDWLQSRPWHDDVHITVVGSALDSLPAKDLDICLHHAGKFQAWHAQSILTEIQSFSILSLLVKVDAVFRECDEETLFREAIAGRPMVAWKLRDGFWSRSARNGDRTVSLHCTRLVRIERTLNQSNYFRKLPVNGAEGAATPILRPGVPLVEFVSSLVTSSDKGSSRT